MTERLKRLIEFLDDEFMMYDGKLIQAFFCENTSGDQVYVVYEKDGIEVRHCRYWRYIEVLGLTEEEISEIRKWGYNEH